MKPNPETFDNIIKLRDTRLKFRKWKVKDRKKFVTLIQDIDNLDIEKAQESLVYDCLEKPDIALSPTEFRYIITQIRAKSLGKIIPFTFKCGKCAESYTVELDLDDIIKPVFEPYKIVKVGDISVEFGDIPNKEYYDAAIRACDSDAEVYMVDFLWSIRKVSGSDVFTFTELEEYFNNLDVDVLDAILDEWDIQRFKIDDTVKVTCPHCEEEDVYSFDDINGFFPNTWFER